MIRYFDWRDVGLVKTLGDQAVCLDAETGLTRGSRPLSNALLSYLMPGLGAPTLIWRQDSRSAFGQLRHRPGREQAHVLSIAPACDEAAEGWLAMAEQLASAAGERGAHSLIAEVPENSCEFETLRAAGYAIYARQSLWRLSGPATGDGHPADAPGISLRAAASADLVGATTLYMNIVPRLVQQVEPPPHHVQGFVLEHAGEIIAYLSVRRGALGFWVEPFLHPEAYPISGATLLNALALISNPTPLPIYVCVRRYQDWLQDILARSGFESLGSQAVMVKRLTARITEPLLKPLPAIEGQAPTPIVRVRATRRK